MSPLGESIVLTLLGLFTLGAVVVAFWRHFAEKDPNGWKQRQHVPEQHIPFEPAAAMRAAAMSVRVPLPRIPRDDMDSEAAS